MIRNIGETDTRSKNVLRSVCMDVINRSSTMVSNSGGLGDYWDVT